MKDDIVLTVKKTFENSANVHVCSVYEKDNTIFGVYINSVDDILSFLQPPRLSYDTNIGDFHILFFELGAILYGIYCNGGIKLIDMLDTSVNIIEPSFHFQQLCSLVFENIPLNVYKHHIISDINQILDTKDYDEKKIQNLFGMLYTYNKYNQESNINFDEYSIKNMTESNIIYVLNDIKNTIINDKHEKISEATINKINEHYILLHKQ